MLGIFHGEIMEKEKWYEKGITALFVHYFSCLFMYIFMYLCDGVFYIGANQAMGEKKII